MASDIRLRCLNVQAVRSGIAEQTPATPLRFAKKHEMLGLKVAVITELADYAVAHLLGREAKSILLVEVYTRDSKLDYQRHSIESRYHGSLIQTNRVFCFMHAPLLHIMIIVAPATVKLLDGALRDTWLTAILPQPPS
jgi:hypothetical protein